MNSAQRIGWSLIFLCIACARHPNSPSSVDQSSNLERMKRAHPDFDHFLCGNVDSAENFDHSLVLWKHGERSICKENESDIAFRLAYWKMNRGMLVVRLERTPNGPLLVSKRIEYATTGGVVDSQWVVQEDHPITLKGADSLMFLLSQVDLRRFAGRNGRCLDGNVWHLEVNDPRGYGYHRIYCEEDEALAHFGEFVRDKINLSYPIN